MQSMMLKPLSAASAAVLATVLALPASAQTYYTETFEGAQASNGAYGVGPIPGTGMAVVNGNVWIGNAEAAHGKMLNLGSGWYSSFDPQTQIGSSTAQSVASFDLLAGHTYTLSFDYSRQGWSAGNGPFSTSITASFGGQSVSYADVAGFYYGLEWKPGQLIVTPVTDLPGVHVVFTAAGPAGYSGMLVDNISMVGLAPVPEPQAATTLLLGLAGLALLVGRRRQQQHEDALAAR